MVSVTAMPIVCLSTCMYALFLMNISVSFMLYQT